jgi:hypothetical protein
LVEVTKELERVKSAHVGLGENSAANIDYWKGCAESAEARVAELEARNLEAIVDKFKNLIAWLEADSDNIHHLDPEGVQYIRDWLNGSATEEVRAQKQADEHRAEHREIEHMRPDVERKPQNVNVTDPHRTRGGFTGGV